MSSSIDFTTIASFTSFIDAGLVVVNVLCEISRLVACVVREQIIDGLKDSAHQKNVQKDRLQNTRSQWLIKS